MSDPSGRPREQLSLPLSGGEIHYRVRRSPRARRVRVNVDAHAGVEVVLPVRAAEREAAAAIRELRPWIERRLGEAEAVRARLAARSGTVPYLGQALTLVFEPGRTRPGCAATGPRWSCEPRGAKALAAPAGRLLLIALLASSSP